MSKKAIIIGAGYGGMALANLLGKVGYKVLVLEKNDTLGGRIRVTKKAGYTFDLGPSWYLMPEVFEQYYGLFGASARKRLDLIRLSPGYKVFFEYADPVVVAGTLKQDAALFDEIEPGAGQRLKQYVTASSRTYDVSLKHFLYSNFTRFRDIMQPSILAHTPTLLRLTTQSLHSYVSRHFHDSRLQQILEYQMVFLGSSPFHAPAIYTLMSHLDFKTGVFYPKRGMTSLVDDLLQLGEAFDIDYRTKATVQKIRVNSGRAVGVELADGSIEDADIVVSNADLHHTETKLLAGADQSFPESYWQKRQPGPGALLISLGIKKQLPQLLHHNLYFVKEWRKNFDDIYESAVVPEHASLYVCNPSKTDRSLAPKGRENIFILVPIPAGKILPEQEQQRVADRIITTLGTAINEPDLAAHVETRLLFGPEDFGSTFNAWQYNAFGGESHVLSQSIFKRTPNKSRKVKNLYYVGAGTLPGIGLPMCLIGAQLAFKRIIGSIKSGPLIEEELL